MARYFEELVLKVGVSPDGHSEVVRNATKEEADAYRRREVDRAETALKTAQDKAPKEPEKATKVAFEGVERRAHPRDDTPKRIDEDAKHSELRARPSLQAGRGGQLHQYPQTGESHPYHQSAQPGASRAPDGKERRIRSREDVMQRERDDAAHTARRTASRTGSIQG